MVAVKEMTVAYAQNTVLSKVSFELPQGGLCGILGPNGAGKSTLFKGMLGLTPLVSGEVRINGAPLSKKNIVYVPQKGEIDWQFPATVLDVVLMGRYPHLHFWQQLSQKDRALAHEALAAVGIADLANRQIGALSGGQQQRVFLARAICQAAEVLLLDEPFVGVDAVTEQKIVEILKNLAAEGKTLFVVHHDLSKVRQYFSHTLLLNRSVVAFGETAAVFTPENITKTYEIPYFLD
jgi:manganese/zinc/iron transport system ATP- binding protein